MPIYVIGYCERAPNEPGRREGGSSFFFLEMSAETDRRRRRHIMLHNMVPGITVSIILMANMMMARVASIMMSMTGPRR